MAEILKCTKCGTENSPDSVRCHSCKTKLEKNLQVVGAGDQICKSGNKKRLLLKISTVLFAMALIVFVIGGIVSAGKSSSDVAAITPQPPTPTPISYTSIDVETVIAGINQARQSGGDTSFREVSTLDKAAAARAQYMASNNVLNNTTGNTVSAIEAEGYYPDGSLLQSAWSLTSNQEAVSYMMGSQSKAFGYSSGYSDIGGGVAVGTINGQQEDILVIYLANPQTTSSTSTSTIPPWILDPATPFPTPTPSCPYWEYAGTYPNCYMPTPPPIQPLY